MNQLLNYGINLLNLLKINKHYFAFLLKIYDDYYFF